MATGELQTSPSISISRDRSRKEISWVLTGQEDENAAVAHFKATFGDYVTVDGQKCYLESLDIDHVGYQIYECVGIYESRKEDDDSPDAAYAVSFNTGGGTVHLSHSSATKQVRTVDGDQSLSTFGNLIGVTPDGVEGVDVGSPVFRWTEELEIPIASFTNAYVRTCAYATKKVNSVAFRGFPPGEVLVDDVSASTTQKDGETIAKMTFQFAHSPNVTGLTIGDIPGNNKKGWEYLWVVTEDVVVDISGTKVLTKKPVAVIVEEVYPGPIDIAATLGLPT